MNRFYPIVLFFLLFQYAVFSQSSSSAELAQLGMEATKTAMKSKQVIVQLAPKIAVADFLQNANAICSFAEQIKIEKTLVERRRIYLLSASQILDREAFIDFLRRMPEVESASWNAKITFRDSIPNDELFDTQWSLERIGAPKVWDISTGGQTVSGREIVVAVLDKGFDIIHPDLFDNAWKNPAEIPNDGIDNDGNDLIDDVYGWNFRANSPLFSLERHGTSVSGIIGAKGNNGQGIAGINWNIKMMYLAVEFVDEVIAGFNYVLEQRELYNQTNGEKGAFVVVTNGSFGIDQAKCSEQPAWGSLYDELGQAGVLSVAATANGGWDVDQVGDIPTSCPSPYLISVTNTGEDDKRDPGAAYGQQSIDLGAPGQSISTSTTNADYRQDFSGTSAACPHVAGSVALLYSLPCTMLDSMAMNAPADCALLVRNAILDNTDDVPSLSNETVTGGRLNVYEGMKYLHAYCISREPEREDGNFKELYVGGKSLIRVTPNPTTDKIYIDYGNVDFKQVKVRIFNMLGQELIFNQVATPEPFQPQSIEVDVKDWIPGVYVVNMFDLTKKISVSFLKK